jgi:hypothetical protein
MSPTVILFGSGACDLESIDTSIKIEFMCVKRSLKHIPLTPDIGSPGKRTASVPKPLRGCISSHKLGPVHIS